MVRQRGRVEAAAGTAGFDDMDVDMGLGVAPGGGGQPLKGAQAPGTKADDANAGHGNSKGPCRGSVYIFSTPVHVQ